MNLVKYFLIILLGSGTTALATTASSAPTTTPSGTPSASELVKFADRARGTISQGAKWHVFLENKDGEDTTKQEYEVKVLGSDALAETTFPPRNKGDTLLFNDQKLWFFKQGLKKPVAFSKKQRLSGVAANGDIAASNYVRDYEAKIIGDDKIGNDDAWLLMLTAKTSDATYDKIRYWITKKSRLGMQAEIQSTQGKPLKKITVEYANTLTTVEGEIPFMSKMIIQDITFPNKVSTMVYETPTAAKLAPSLFNVNNLTR